jgi:hypothetical protein
VCIDLLALRAVISKREALQHVVEDARDVVVEVIDGQLAAEGDRAD